MADLGGAGIDFDQVRHAGLVAHEVEAVQSVEPESRRDLARRLFHFRALHAPHPPGGTRGAIPVDDVHVQCGENAPSRAAKTLVAGLPGTKACTLTSDVRGVSASVKKWRSLRRTARTRLRNRAGGPFSFAKACSASPRVRTSFTPPPPQLASDFITQGRPTRSSASARPPYPARASVSGAAMASSRAAAMDGLRAVRTA